MMAPQSLSPCHGLSFFHLPRDLPRSRAAAAAAPIPHYSFWNSQISKSLLSPKLTTSISIKKPCRSNNDRRPRESPFFDEDGVIQDMDGYLNYLSLEYDSVWDTKPSWCQPWTITSTGVLIITGSWFVLHSVIVTVVVLSLICAWWYIFLYSYPKAYSEMIAERKKKVTSGVEDTYGKGVGKTRGTD